MTTPNHKIRLVMDLRRAGVSDTRVLSAMERTPREAFCAPQFLDRAYDDTALPIAHGQTLSQPSVVGLMTQAAECGPRHKVLEVGTGSGYQAAILAALCRRLYTIERHRPLRGRRRTRRRCDGAPPCLSRAPRHAAGPCGSRLSSLFFSAPPAPVAAAGRPRSRPGRRDSVALPPPPP
jgi:hypothetical protein